VALVMKVTNAPTPMMPCGWYPTSTADTDHARHVTSHGST
jgi:hypothetical protein